MNIRQELFQSKEISASVSAYKKTQRNHPLVWISHHVFSIASVFLSAWVLVESQLLVWGPSGSTWTAEWYFHTAPRHLLLKGSPS